MIVIDLHLEETQKLLIHMLQVIHVAHKLIMEFKKIDNIKIENENIIESQ